MFKLLTLLAMAPILWLNVAAETANRPLLLANYYCWYQDGEHAKKPFLHWTYPSSSTNALALKAQKPGEPAPNSAFRPLIGLYDSADPKIAEWHVQLAKAASHCSMSERSSIKSLRTIRSCWQKLSNATRITPVIFTLRKNQ
jgi:hypothetical protein